MKKSARILASHDFFEFLFDPFARPVEVLEVLDRLEVAYGHTTGVGQYVGDDNNAPLT